MIELQSTRLEGTCVDTLGGFERWTLPDATERKLKILTFDSLLWEQEHQCQVLNSPSYSLPSHVQTWHWTLVIELQHRARNKRQRERGGFVIECNVDTCWSLWYLLTACHRARAERRGWLTLVTAVKALHGKSRLQLLPTEVFSQS